MHLDMKFLQNHDMEDWEDRGIKEASVEGRIEDLIIFLVLILEGE